MTARVDVVVVTFKSEATIANCLNSLPGTTHVVVVDNASPDRAAAIASSAGATVTRNRVNRGFGAAANQGAKQATREFVLFLNPDAELRAHCLESLVAEMDARPELAVVGPAVIDSPAGPQTAYWPFPGARDTWGTALGLHRVRKRPARSAGFVPGTCMLVRRAVFDQLGGFDERFWLYGEDADFGWRALALGGRSAVVDGAAVDHANGHSAKQTSTSFEHFHRGAELFIAARSGVWALASHRLGVLVGAVVRAVALVFADRARSRWFARLAVRQVRVLLRWPHTPAPDPAAKDAR